MFFRAFAQFPLFAQKIIVNYLQFVYCNSRKNMLYYNRKGKEKTNPEKDVRDKKEILSSLLKGWYGPMKK